MLRQDSIPSLLRSRSDLSPDALALLGLGRKPLSYRGLLGQVEQVVQTLNGFGIGRSDKDAIVLENRLGDSRSCFLVQSHSGRDRARPEPRLLLHAEFTAAIFHPDLKAQSHHCRVR